MEGTCDALLSLQLSRSRLDGPTHLLPRAERRPARFEAADDPSRRHLWTLQLNARANGFGLTLRSNRRLQGCSSIGPLLLHDSAPCVRPERRARVAGLLSGSAWLPVENRFPRAWQTPPRLPASVIGLNLAGPRRKRHVSGDDLKRRWPHHLALPSEKVRGLMSEPVFCGAGALSATPLTGRPGPRQMRPPRTSSCQPPSWRYGESPARWSFSFFGRSQQAHRIGAAREIEAQLRALKDPKKHR